MHYRKILLFGTAVAVVPIAIVWTRYYALKTKIAVVEFVPPNETATKPTRTTASSKRQTVIHAHNLLLKKGPDFRIYVRWLDGFLAQTRNGRHPSLGDSTSFALDIQSGVIRVNIGDLGHYLNAGVRNSPLKNIVLTADGDKLKLTGTVHKLVDLPVVVVAEIFANPDNRVRLHVIKIDVLKLPVKGLLGLFKITVADLVKQNIDGIQIDGSDVLFDTHKLMPPPHIDGKLSAVRVVSPDLEEIYGDAAEDMQKVETWRNFLRLKGGVLDFGNLTMNSVDIIMIDISDDPWFNLDLIDYQKQLAAGYTRMTSKAGLQIFMPDLREVKLKTVSDDIEWFKNRNIPPPHQIVKSTH